MKYTGTNQGKYAFHFVADTLRDGRPIPADGVWLEHEGAIKICSLGLHASREVADALGYAPGNTLCLVEVGGIAEEQSDKLVARRRKIVARFDAAELLWADARESAKSVLENWATPVPQVVLEWLNTGDVRYKADAYRAALSAAAHSAARYAADSAAAHSAARYAARKRLHYAVMAKFEEMGVISK